MRAGLVNSIYARAIALGLAYWLAVVLSIEMVSPVDKIALFWPPNAIVAAVLIFSSRKHWPHYIVAMVLAFFAARVHGGHLPFHVIVGFCSANIIEVLIVSGVVKRFIHDPITHENLTRVLSVAILAAIPASLVSALIGGVLVSSAIEKANFMNALIGWFTGDLLGLLLVLPVLLTWVASGAPLIKSYGKAKITEHVTVAAAFVAVGLLTAVYLTKEIQIGLIFPYLVFPVLVWAAMRLGIRSTTVAVLSVGLFAISLTYLGQGPFNIEGLSAFGQVILMKVGLIIITLTTMFLSLVVTERKRAEGAYKDSEERYRRFAADVAHELRTPLSTMRLHLDNLDDLKTAQSLEHDVTSMSRLVEQLLDLARLDALHIGADDKADLSEVCANVIMRLGPIAIKEGRSLELAGANNSVMVNGNADTLALAVRNLVENAIKYSGGDSEITIEIIGNATIKVIDRGRGLPKEQHKTIFERFERSDQRGGGAGLGLSIARHAVESHGGTLEISETPGGGATFTISLANTVQT